MLGFARYRNGSDAPSKLIELVRQPNTQAGGHRRRAKPCSRRPASRWWCAPTRPGRIIDRLVRPKYNAALRFLDEGLATAKDMDLTCRLGLGYPRWAHRARRARRACPPPRRARSAVRGVRHAGLRAGAARDGRQAARGKGRERHARNSRRSGTTSRPRATSTSSAGTTASICRSASACRASASAGATRRCGRRPALLHLLRGRQPGRADLAGLSGTAREPDALDAEDHDARSATWCARCAICGGARAIWRDRSRWCCSADGACAPTPAADALVDELAARAQHRARSALDGGRQQTKADTAEMKIRGKDQLIAGALVVECVAVRGCRARGVASLGKSTAGRARHFRAERARDLWATVHQRHRLELDRAEETMPRHKSYVPHGVIPAVLLPFDADLAIDEASFRKHLRDVAATARHLRHHHQRAFHRGRLLHLRGAAARARHRAGRDRRPPAARQRHLGRRQPRGGAPRPHGGRGRRVRAAGVPAGALHARPVAGRWRSPTSSASPMPPTCR